MKIKKLSIKCIKGYKEESGIELSDSINVIVGRNNSGKSTILNSILHIQVPNLSISNITLKEKKGNLSLVISDPNNAYLKASNNVPIDLSTTNNEISIDIEKGKAIQTKILKGKGHVVAKAIDQKEPDNYIYPYLSKRKVAKFAETINSDSSDSVKGNFTHLYAKIDRLSNPYYQPGHGHYIKYCENILGFVVSSIPSKGGKKSAYVVHNNFNIPIDSMGEGVANILGLIVDLCIAENNLFLIEEPENDIHPQALKKLLELIKEKSETNQFIITTHSNIVLKSLGADENTKIFEVKSKIQEGDFKLPISMIKEVSNDPTSKLKVLEDLGYEFNDYGMWQSWVFFEESSLEEFVRDLFIPWYCEKLKGILRTFSSRTVGEVIPKFKNFNDLFVYLHLEPIYKDKAWVIIDKGDEETKILDKLKKIYVDRNGWNPKRFIQLTKHSFEEYYPSKFKKEIDEALSESDSNKKRELKAALLKKVKKWAVDNPEKAKPLFSKSAKEIIDILKLIEKEISES